MAMKKSNKINEAEEAKKYKAFKAARDAKAKKASYSPKPMSAAAKAKAAAAGKATAAAKAKPTKKAMKFPTGELPKRISPWAAQIGADYENMTPSRMANIAGWDRDMGRKMIAAEVINKKNKQSRAAGTAYKPAPMSAAAKKKAAAAGKATGTKTKPKPASRKPKAGSGVASKVVKRAKTTAREARDVVTAAGTLGTRAFTASYKKDPGNPIKNLARQVKETGKAAVTGKKGTTSDRFGRAIPGRPGWTDMSYGYEKGKKRK
jgi:hypothetical protein